VDTLDPTASNLSQSLTEEKQPKLKSWINVLRVVTVI